jgi:lipoate-protein ligase A
VVIRTPFPGSGTIEPDKRRGETVHGEYKTPGGKLVVVDFDVNDNRLRGVEVTGDFFVYPEESFTSLASALEGAPADLDEPALTDLVQQAIPAGTELLGTSARGIAIAVGRALHEANG